MTRTIRTAAELDALPVGSVAVGSDSGRAYQRDIGGWYAASSDVIYASELSEFEEYVLVHDPSAPALAPSVVPEAAVEAAASAVRRSREFIAGATIIIPLAEDEGGAS